MNKKAHKIRVFEKIPQKHKILVKSVISQKAELMVAKFNHEDNMAACGFSDGFLRIYNLTTDNKISEVDTNLKPKQHAPINCLRWRPHNSNNSTGSVLLVASTNGNLYQYVAKTGKMIFHTSQQQNHILAMDYCPDATSFATAGKDNIIRVYDEETKKISQELKGTTWQKTGHNNRLFSIKYKTDESDLLVSGGWDMNVNVWDIRIGEVVSTIYGPKISGDAVDIKDKLILTGSNRGTEQLQLWDWSIKEIVHTFEWSEKKENSNTFLFCAQFSKNTPNHVLACGGTQMKIFSSEDYQELAQVKFEQGDSLYTLDTSHGVGKYLVGGKAGQLVYLGGNKMIQ